MVVVGRLRCAPSFVSCYLGSGIVGCALQHQLCALAPGSLLSASGLRQHITLPWQATERSTVPDAGMPAATHARAPVPECLLLEVRLRQPFSSPARQAMADAGVPAAADARAHAPESLLCLASSAGASMRSHDRLVSVPESPMRRCQLQQTCGPLRWLRQLVTLSMIGR